MSEAVARKAGAVVAFNPDAMAEYERIITRYPQRRAALMPVLWLAQREFGWISPEVQAYVAGLMGLPVGWVEGANGELGFYVVSDGSGRPYRVRVRPPCFLGMAALGEMMRGIMIADIITTFGMVNMIGGECDR